MPIDICISYGLYFEIFRSYGSFQEVKIGFCISNFAFPIFFHLAFQMVYERSKERGIRDEEQRHNDNDDQHNEIFGFCHDLAINFSAIASNCCGIMDNGFREIPSDRGLLQNYPYQA